MNTHGSIPIKLYVWTLKFKFHVSQNIIVLSIFIQPFKNEKRNSQFARCIFGSWTNNLPHLTMNLESVSVLVLFIEYKTHSF